jgi:hypothetical protein
MGEKETEDVRRDIKMQKAVKYITENVKEV